MGDVQRRLPYFIEGVYNQKRPHASLGYRPLVEYEATLGMVGTGAFYSTAQGAKIHIRAEWWSCPDHGTAIIVVGAGQWGNTLSSSRIQNILVGRQADDMDTVYNIQRLMLETRCA
jgi:hypothetical protein